MISSEVSSLAEVTGCKTEKLFFLYLGLLVGASMAKTNSWDPIFKKFAKRLSEWKVSMFSIGGRLTLVTFVFFFVRYILSFDAQNAVPSKKEIRITPF